MGFGKLRFRRSFGQVKSQFRGAIPKHFPLVQRLLDLYPATAAYSAYDLGNKRGAVTETEGGTRYVVSGAGTAAVNGEYVENGLSANGNKAYTLYSNGAVAFNMWSYGSTGWWITSSAVDSSPVFENIYYEELTASTTPPALLSAAFSGALPTPTVASLTTRTVVNPVQRWRRSSDDALQMFTANGIASGAAMSWLTDDQVGWNTQPFWEVSTGNGVISSQSSTATTSTFSITTTSGASFVRQATKPNHIIASSGDQVVANITMSGFDSAVTGLLRTSGTNTNVSSLALNNGTADYTFTPTGSAGYFVFSGIEATGGATLTVNSVKVVSRNAYLLTEYDQHDTGLSALYGSARYFNGTSTYVDCGANLIAVYPFELTATIATTASSSVMGVVSTAATGSSAKYGVEVVNGFPAIRCQSSTAGGQQIVGGTSVADGANHTIRAVFTSSTSRELFVDGVSVGTDAANIAFEGGNRVNVGRQLDSSPANYFSGVITSVDVNGVAAYTGLGTSVTAWEDTTINGNDGTETSGTAFQGQGVAYDLTQTTAANQPLVVSGGALTVDSLGNTAPLLDGVNDGLKTDANYTDTVTEFGMFIVSENTTNTGQRTMVRIRPNGAAGTVDGVTWEQGLSLATSRYSVNSFFEGGGNSTGAATTGQGTQDTDTHINSILFEQSQILGYDDGSLEETMTRVGSGSTPIGNVTFASPIWLGYNFDSSDRPFGGSIAAVLLYNTDQSANRAAIEAKLSTIVTTAIS